MKNYKLYIHHNQINHKVYIGQTCQELEDRWGINGAGYKGQMFYKAILKYGWDSFEHISYKENLTKEEVDELEITLIDYYKNEWGFGCYNIAKGGSIAVHEYPLIEVDLDGNYIRDWESATICAEYYNVTRSIITNTANGRFRSFNGNGFFYKEVSDLRFKKQIKVAPLDSEFEELAENLEDVYWEYK